LLPVPRVPLLGSAARLLNGRRWRRWERGIEEQHQRRSQQIYDAIASGGEDWLAELTRPQA
ncbi:MAG TPA: hypothetical protein VII01_10450, partial [Solirubrobacteraceae bacterium]